MKGGHLASRKRESTTSVHSLFPQVHGNQFHHAEFSALYDLLEFVEAIPSVIAHRKRTPLAPQT